MFLLSSSSVMRWNTRREPMVKHLFRLVRAPGSLVWTNSLSVDAEGYLWIAANRHANVPKTFFWKIKTQQFVFRFHDFYHHGQLDPSNVNFRVFRLPLRGFEAGRMRKSQKEEECDFPRGYTYFPKTPCSSSPTSTYSQLSVIVIALIASIVLKRDI